jgi:hypothetical protein
LLLFERRKSTTSGKLLQTGCPQDRKIDAIEVCSPKEEFFAMGAEMGTGGVISGG